VSGTVRNYVWMVVAALTDIAGFMGQRCVGITPGRNRPGVPTAQPASNQTIATWPTSRRWLQ
jgi:hypothetical protein